MNTKFITTRIESIARSAARRPRYAPAHPQLFRSYSTTTRGGHIAAVCFRHRSPPDLYFATHFIVEGIYPLRIDPSDECRGAASNDVNMLVCTGGRQRSEDEFRLLLHAAGLNLTRIVPTSARVGVIEGVRA
jgi:hypothetical protein